MADSERLQGKTLAPGMGAGEIYIYRDTINRLDEFYEIDESMVADEQGRFERACARVAQDLGSLVHQVEAQMDSDFSAVFVAHLAMLEDEQLKEEVSQRIHEELVSAGAAVKHVFRRWERRFRAMEAETARQKGDDLKDLTRRLLYSLAGIHGHALESMPDQAVLVAKRLLPSDTLYLKRRKAAAAILETGGVGSHAALFAHEIGLPCVSGIVDAVDQLEPGARVLVDADQGEITVRPRQSDEADFERRRRRLQQVYLDAQRHASKPARDPQGRVVPVMANVGTRSDSQEAVDNGADGVGLYRIEQLYLDRQTLPDTESLIESIHRTLLPMGERPVYVRLLDIGADKPLPYLESFRELNPSLGMRGIRFLRHYPHLLDTQLKALLELGKNYDLNIIVPMVALAEDMEAVSSRLAKLAGGRAKRPRLGAMIETPAAALDAGAIAAQADFFSVGTNDLTQYTFAADRENAAVDGYFDDTHPVILKLLQWVHQSAPQVPLSVCGELASRAPAVAGLLAAGVGSLSVVPRTVATIKQAVRDSHGRDGQDDRHG